MLDGRSRVGLTAWVLVARFKSLSDLCSFTVSPARGRWYFHHEGTWQFASVDETLGFCDARIAASP